MAMVLLRIAVRFDESGTPIKTVDLPIRTSIFHAETATVVIHDQGLKGMQHFHHLW